MVVRIVRTGTGRRSASSETEVTVVLCPDGQRATGLSRMPHTRPLTGAFSPEMAPPGRGLFPGNGTGRAGEARVGQSRHMTEPTEPQPRDIALEQETPEQAADLEA